MISQRRAVQFGVISATAVFAACIGVLVFQGDGSTADNAQAAQIQQVDAHSAPASSSNLSLSSAQTPVVHLQSVHH
jgi:hypothetical protein